MDVKFNSLLFLSLLSIYGIDQSASIECNIKEHYECSNNFLEIDVDNACTQIKQSLGCLENVTSACNYDCSEEEEYPYCGMLLGALSAPMGSSGLPKEACRIHSGLAACQRNKCEGEGDRFGPEKEEKDRRGGYGVDQCSDKAKEKCVSPVFHVTEVNKESCVKAAQAKNCFLDALADCSGDDNQGYASDLIIVGLVHHIQQCKKEGFGFTMDGGICVPNPKDVFVLDIKSPTAGLNKETCDLVHGFSEKIERYRKECDVTTHNRYFVDELLSNLSPARIECLKAGYKYTGPGDSGIFCQPSQTIVFMASLLVFFIVSFVVMH